ncbi:MAG: glycosyltransferase family 9 protein [Atribacterota bacterium]
MIRIKKNISKRRRSKKRRFDRNLDNCISSPRRMHWVLQKRGYELGNFIMLTPALQLVFKKNKIPIPVFFNNQYIAILYKKCPFLKRIIKKPDNEPKYSTYCPKRLKGESDIMAWCRIYAKNVKNIPNPYIDPPQKMHYFKKEKDKKYVAVIHGAHPKSVFLKKKSIGPRTISYIINKLLEEGFIPVIIGNKSDKKRFWFDINLEKCINLLGKLNIKKSVDVFNSCDYFISNDTGFYHIGAALKKTGMILWKKTNMKKNMELSDKLLHCKNNTGEFSIYKKFIDTNLEYWK